MKDFTKLEICFIILLLVWIMLIGGMIMSLIIYHELKSEYVEKLISAEFWTWLTLKIVLIKQHLILRKR